MKPDQGLSDLTVELLSKLKSVVDAHRPDCIIAQGDTSTVFAAALIAFYEKVPFCHVEAGLRTNNLSSPWPEEFNRRAVSLCTTLHFAPTEQARRALLAENISDEAIFVTGNTVIDALEWARQKVRKNDSLWLEKWHHLGQAPLVLITGHRRENFGQGFRSVCEGLRDLSLQNKHVKFLYPVHLNPNVQKPVHEILADLPNFYLTPPASYPEFVWLMERSHIIITDSGGVQEEGPSFKKPILVTRTDTERPEAVEAGAATLVGTDKARLISEVTALLNNPDTHTSRTVDRNPYGDGNASSLILEKIKQRLLTQGTQP